MNWYWVKKREEKVWESNLFKGSGSRVKNAVCPWNQKAQWVWRDHAGKSSEKGALTKSTHSQEVYAHRKYPHRKCALTGSTCSQEVEGGHTSRGQITQDYLRKKNSIIFTHLLGSVHICPEESSAWGVRMWPSIEWTLTMRKGASRNKQVWESGHFSQHLLSPVSNPKARADAFPTLTPLSAGVCQWTEWHHWNGVRGMSMRF